MTMLDDETLSTFLHELGDSFAVPASGVADTLRRVRRGDDERDDEGQAEDGRAGDGQDGDGLAEDGRAEGEQARSVRSVRRVIRTHRLLAVAAALVVLLALAGGAAILGSSSPSVQTDAGSKALHAAPAPSTTHGPRQPSSTTTTIPQLKAAAPYTNFNAQASAAPATSGGATSKGGAATGTSPLPTGAVGQAARIEQTGSLSLTVARGALTTTMNKLTTLASAYGGFVANSQTQSSGNGRTDGAGSSGGTGGSNGTTTSDSPPSGTVTLQVPVASFTALLAEAKAFGKPTSVTTKATDVTGQYVDLQARINALELSRQQYLTIMAKATSVGDVLAVQAQLDNLQSQIEQLQGQLAVIDSETTYSTLTVAVSEAGPHHHRTPAPAAASGITKAWHDSLHGFAVGVDGIIRLAGPFLFVLLCLAALVLGGRLTWRRLQRHNL